MKKLQTLYPEIKIGHHEKGVTVILGSFSKQFANDPTFEEVVKTIKKTFPNTSNTTFPTGAVRSTDANHVAYHLISPIGIRRVAETYAEGEKKYGSFQWEKGMPIGDILNHGLNHVFLYLNGDRSEDHLAHAAWNLMAAMHMEETHPNIEHNLRPGKDPTPVPCEHRDTHILDIIGSTECIDCGKKL